MLRPDDAGRGLLASLARHRFGAAHGRPRRGDGRRCTCRLAVRRCGPRPSRRRRSGDPARCARRLSGLRKNANVNAGIFSTPRSGPSRLPPTVAGGLVIFLALPVFAVAGWPLEGWALAAVLWVAAEVFALVLVRLPGGADNLAAAGMRGIGTTSRALLVGIPLVIVTVSDESVGIAAAGLYAVAFTVELAIGLVAYFGAEAQAGSGSAPPAAAGTGEGEDKGSFIPEEWELHEWIPIHIGPIDMSINKAVAYLLLGALCSCLIGIVLMRVKVGKEPTRRQALGETIYEIEPGSVAEKGPPTKGSGRWFPYVASLMIFIWTVNMLGFIPLPLSDEKVTIFGLEVPTLAIFAATSPLSVTLALALMTWMFTHVEGIRANGSWNYFKSWIPDVPKVMLPLIIPLEILGQFMRLISLSVRLYAKMLARHMQLLPF